MKKLYLLGLLSLFVGQLKAQQTVQFVFKYLPNTNYTSSVVAQTSGEINFKGSEEDLKKLKASGANEKMTLTGTMQMAYTIKSGSYKTDKVFPVLLTYNSINNKQLLDGKEMPTRPNVFVNKSIFAHSDAGGKLKIDSVSNSANNADSVIKVVAAVIDNFNRQINFPEKGMKIGDTFTQDLPMNLPVMGSNVAVAMTLTYNLTAIKNDIGYFDVSQTAAFTFPTTYGAVDIKGTGNGKLEFSVKKSFPIKYESLSEITYAMKIENLEVAGLAKVNTVLTTNIE
jgi:hypothetical protein